VLAVAFAAGGCSAGSSRTFEHDRPTVFRAAVAEAVAWRPTSIDEEEHRIAVERSDLSGNAWRYVVKVEPVWNPFAGEETSRVRVSAWRTEPVRQRLLRVETEYLLGMASRLESAEPPE
jgi:hypothetical protein